MFERERHRAMARLLRRFEADLLANCKCYFGGGSAIVMQLNEYRESVDLDFLCADLNGYRALRNAIKPPTLGNLLREPVLYARDVRTERDKVTAFVLIDDLPVKVEIILEARISLSGDFDERFGVPVLSTADLYAEKLLANADRGLDRSTMSRDLIDLSMMMRSWGPIPAAAIQKVEVAYGASALGSFDEGLGLLEDSVYREECLRKMRMDPALSATIVETLRRHRPKPILP